MKKLITVLAVLVLGVSAFAFPKFTMLDYNCGNTPEYIAQFVELDKGKKMEKEHAKYIFSLKAGTWLIEFDDGQKIFCSVYQGKVIVSGYVKK